MSKTLLEQEMLCIIAQGSNWLTVSRPEIKGEATAPSQNFQKHV